MTDDNLKEILGFDPESGHRTGEENGIPVHKKGLRLAPTEEARKIFQDVFSERYKSLTDFLKANPNAPQGFHLYPEHLLFVHWSHNVYERTYYAIPVQKEDEYESWEHSERNALRFETSEDGKGYEWVAVNRYDESPYSHRMNANFISIHFSREERDVLGKFGIQIKRGRNTVDVFYDSEGNLKDLTTDFCYEEWRKPGYFSNSLSLSRQSRRGETVTILNDFYEACETTTVPRQRDGKGKTTAVYLQDEGIIEVSNENVGKITDIIRIPVKVDEKEIFEKLFSQRLLDHPFKALPEDDETWRYADLQKVFGVSWEEPLYPADL